MHKSISILLGAGFSAPAGYPIGKVLNEKLLNITNDLISFSPDGTLVFSVNGTKPDFGYNTMYDINFEYCIELIKHYNDKIQSFDYEEFYDYIVNDVRNDQEAKKLAIPYSPDSDFNQLVDGLVTIYNQLVSYLLRDKKGNTWYDNQTYYIGNSYSGYTGFLRYLKSLDIDTIINIHTLNHDLFFESLNNTVFLNGELCDGFEELGSPYYGEIEKDGHCYLCRLKRYVGNYNTKFRLYKLHGSLDYRVFSNLDEGVIIPENYIKTRYGIGSMNLYKEKMNKDGKLEYENCWINYHADFLTGTTSKIERYEDNLFYGKLFEKFKVNLISSDILIIVGYGAKDEEINKMIIECFKYKGLQDLV
ncbi:MAG: hypothetical protein Q7U47_09380 [Paludibacter sp.]|nr:hypothetical protein [Paludibacter sp.]